MPNVHPRSALLIALIPSLVACGTARVAEPPARPIASVVAVTPPPTTAEATAAAPPAPVKIRSVEGIDEYVLGNGMSVLLFPDATQSTVTVNITYFVGSKHEGFGETGMAHLLEHMLFKGTPRHRNVLKLLDERGGFANGTTWTDRTNYYETLPATAANLTWALGLEADRMLHASISDDDLKTEFSVVRNELEIGENDPAAILEERVVSTAYLWHNYGKSTIGSRSDVENVPTTRLRIFYQQYYQPDNAMLVVAGKFDPAMALDEINRSFGVLPRPTRTLPPSYTVEPVQDGERSVTLRRTGDVHLVLALYHAVAAADPDHVAFDALEDLLTGEPSGRLYRKLVEPGLASNVDGSHYLWRDPTFLAIRLRAKDGAAVAKARSAALGVIEGFAKQPVTTAEVERWKARRLKELAMLASDSRRVAVDLSEWAAAGDWRLLFVYRDRVKALTAADVQRVALAYLKPSNRTLGEFIPTPAPDRAPSPRAVDVGAAVATIAAGMTDDGEAFVASLDNLTARTTMRQLAGGLRAAFLAKKTRGNKVVLTLTFRHGDATSLVGKREIAALTAALVERGTRGKSFEQLEDAKNALTANVDIGGGAGAISVRIKTVRTSLPAVIDLLAEVLQQPALKPAELEVVRRQALADLEEQRQDPNAVAYNRFLRLLAPWPKSDVRATPTLDEEVRSLKAVTIGQIRAYHQTFWGAGDGEIVAVGDFDSDALATQLERHFGGWKRKASYARLVDRTFGAAPVTEQLDTKDKEMAIIVGGHDVALRDDHVDMPALILASHVFGDSSASRLWMRLREKEGLSYSTWGYISPGQLDPVGQVGFAAMLAPQNLGKGKAALLEELARLIKDGVTDAEVNAARVAWREQQDNLLANDERLVSVLARDRFLGRDFAWHQDLRARVAKVTAADVNRVLKTWLTPDRLIIVSAGDLSKTK